MPTVSTRTTVCPGCGGRGSGRSSSSTERGPSVTATLMTPPAGGVGEEGDHLVGDEVGRSVQRVAAVGEHAQLAPSIAAAYASLCGAAG